MKIIKTIFAVLIPLSILGQTENINSAKYHLAKKVFENEYQKAEYQKFSPSQIKVKGNKVFLTEIKILEFDKESDNNTKLILASGLLDPYEINKGHHLKIRTVEELPLLNPDSQTKRFKFWGISPKKETAEVTLMNPIEYYFELQNESATENTSIEDFVNGATLTFLKSGGIIL